MNILLREGEEEETRKNEEIIGEENQMLDLNTPISSPLAHTSFSFCSLASSSAFSGCAVLKQELHMFSFSGLPLNEWQETHDMLWVLIVAHGKVNHAQGHTMLA